MCDWTFSIEEVRKDIKEENYGEKDVQKLLYELEHDTMDYSAYDNAMAIIYYMDLYNGSLKEIERLKEEGIGDTKFDKLLFSIRMLHFHNYLNDIQFAEMIKKLSNENKGE